MEYVGPPDDPHAHERKYPSSFLPSFPIIRDIATNISYDTSILSTSPTRKIHPPLLLIYLSTPFLSSLLPKKPQQPKKTTKMNLTQIIPSPKKKKNLLRPYYLLEPNLT
jgi:hypothetical protein